MPDLYGDICHMVLYSTVYTYMLILQMWFAKPLYYLHILLFYILVLSVTVSFDSYIHILFYI